MRRVVLLALALTLAGAVAWVAAVRMESPNQAAARAEAPAPAPVVASLDHGYLQGQVSMSTTAQRERLVAIKPPASLTGVVTADIANTGDTLKSGSLLIRQNGRPLFVLSGPFPLYRDLQKGDTGDDVAAIQAGLIAAGYSIGRDHSGSYGSGTQAAVSKMYTTAGYQAPESQTASTNGSPESATTSPSAAPTPDQAAAATTSTGPRVVTTEVMLISDLPAVIQAVAPVGTQLAAGPDLVTLGAGQVVLTTTLPNSSVSALKVGATGSYTDDAGAPGSAQVVGMTPDAAGDQTIVSLSSGGAVSPGSAYVVTIDNPGLETGESLLAPIAAVVSRGGRSYVYVQDAQAFREVEVQVTGAVGGVAAITSVDPKISLAEGTEVRVG